MPVHRAPPPFTQATTARYELDLKALLKMHRSMHGAWVFPAAVFMACVVAIGLVLLVRGVPRPSAIYLIFAACAVPVLRSLSVRAAYEQGLQKASGGAAKIQITASIDQNGIEIDGGWQRTTIRWDGLSSYVKNDQCLVLYRIGHAAATIPTDRVPVSFIAGATRYLDGAQVPIGQPQLHWVRKGHVTFAAILVVLLLLLATG